MPHITQGNKFTNLLQRTLQRIQMRCLGQSREKGSRAFMPSLVYHLPGTSMCSLIWKLDEPYILVVLWRPHCIGIVANRLGGETQQDLFQFFLSSLSNILPLGYQIGPPHATPQYEEGLMIFYWTTSGQRIFLWPTPKQKDREK
jgi:hypothetical protein